MHIQCVQGTQRPFGSGPEIRSIVAVSLAAETMLTNSCKVIESSGMVLCQCVLLEQRKASSVTGIAVSVVLSLAVFIKISPDSTMTLPTVARQFSSVTAYSNPGSPAVTVDFSQYVMFVTCLLHGAGKACLF